MGYYIDEESIKSYLDDYLEYLKGKDKNIVSFYVRDNERNAGAWYNHEPETGEHRIFFNLDNLDYLLYYLAQKEITVDQFFGILTLFVGHEFRHFLQGRCMWDGEEVEGFSENDGFETQLMLYIRYFFDVYYLRNKGYLKCEEDAEMFAIENGIAYIKKRFPNVNAEKSILDSANFLGSIHGKAKADMQTLPYHSDSIDELLNELKRRIDANYRHPWLPATLRASGIERVNLQIAYGIDYASLMTDEFIYTYRDIEGGFDKDLYVAKRLLDKVNDPEKSLNEFNIVKKRYLANKL